jgi:hypothetical protein
LVELEVGATDVPLVSHEEVRTIRVPDVVGSSGMTVYRCPIEATAAKSALEEMLQSGGGAKYRVSPGLEGGNAIGQIGDAFTVAIANLLATIKDIIVYIGGDHEELVDEAGGERAVVALPGMKQCHLGDEIAHAVGDNRDFRLARFGGIAHSGRLVAEENCVEIIEHAREVVGARACLVAIRQVVVNLAFRRPGKKNANAETIRSGEETVVDAGVEVNGAREAVVVAVDTEGEMLFFLLLLGRKIGELGTRGDQGFAKLHKRDAPPIINVAKLAGIIRAIADQKVTPFLFRLVPVPPPSRALIIQYWDITLSVWIAGYTWTIFRRDVR